ncbi:MAG: DUF4129 domain-containing protein [Ornithinimicrobium sp.]
MTGGPTARTRAALLLLAALLGSAVLLWGSTSGDSVISAPTATFDTPTPTRDTSSQTAPVQDLDLGSPPADSESGSFINGWLLLQIVIAALIAWWALRFFREGDRVEPVDPVEGTDELAQLLDATSTKDPDGRRFGGEPRNAVVACWVALEDGLASAGLTPAPSETSLDLTVRVLDRWQVPAEALHTLATLYREARFSRHAITVGERDQAVAALGSIHSSLRHAAEIRGEHRASLADGDDKETSTRGGPG